MANPAPLTAQLIPFDSELGRQAGLKSAQVRLELMENGRRYQQAEQRVVEQGEQEQATHQKEVQRQIEITNEQVSLTRARLNDTKSHFCEHCERGGLGDKERAGLLRELRGLLEHLCRLNNVPQAPQQKVGPSRTPRQPAPCLPIVAPVQADTTIPSGVPTPIPGSTPQDTQGAK